MSDDDVYKWIALGAAFLLIFLWFNSHVDVNWDAWRHTIPHPSHGETGSGSDGGAGSGGGGSAPGGDPRGLILFPLSDYVMRIPKTEIHPDWVDLSPSQTIQYLRDNGMTGTILCGFGHLGYAHFRSPEPTTSTGDVVYSKPPYVEDYADALDAAGMYYFIDIWRFWHGLERQNRHPEDFAGQEITTGDYIPYLQAIARLIGERFGDRPGFVGVTWDFEYGGWASASAPGRAGPEFNNSEEAFMRWMCDPSVEGGFLNILRSYKPDCALGMMPNQQYAVPPVEDPYVFVWPNHLNLRSSGDFWGHVHSYETASHGDPQLAVGVSVENGELDWHVAIDHVYHYGNGWTSPYGLRDHVLYWLLFNPRFVSVWGFTNEPAGISCPVCGATELLFDREESEFLERIGSRLSGVAYDPSWLGCWGDLYAPRDNSTDLFGSKPSWIDSETRLGVAYMATSGQLWVINFNEESITVTVSIRGSEREVQVDGYSFTVIQVA